MDTTLGEIGPYQEDSEDEMMDAVAVLDPRSIEMPILPRAALADQRQIATLQARDELRVAQLELRRSEDLPHQRACSGADQTPLLHHQVEA